MEKAKVEVSQSERVVLEEASHGTVVPTKKLVNEFKSLLTKKLIEHKGNNKYTASKLGLYVLTDTVSTNGNGTHETAKEKAESGKKPQAKAKPAFLNKPKASIAELDATYTKKYPHYVKGSVKESKEGGKRIALIKCTHKGCKDTRQVFTSDIFQVKLCEEHRKKKAA